MFGKIRSILLFSDYSRSEMKAVIPQIMEENRKYSIIWSIVSEVFWIYCLIMTTRDPMYRECTWIYASALAVCAVTLALAISAARRHTWLIRSIAIVLEEVLLVAGIMIARYLAPRTILVFASVLIVPVVFISDTLSILMMLLINLLLFTQVGSRSMDPDTYGWVLSNLVIFSAVGLVIGHFVNRARFERFLFAESSAKLAKKQARLARHDQLTDLQNRRAYAEETERIARKLPASCQVVIADINGLKETNDRLGHNAGDELIVGMAECLRKCFPGTDRIYRMGGDEFCVIVTYADFDMEKALKRLQELSAGWKGKYISGISISVGVASAEEFGDLASTVKAADQRMYENKKNYYEKSGRDRRQRRTDSPAPQAAEG